MLFLFCIHGPSYARLPVCKDLIYGYYSQSGNNRRKLRACSRACGYYYPTMEAVQNTYLVTYVTR